MINICRQVVPGQMSHSMQCQVFCSNTMFGTEAAGLGRFGFVFASDCDLRLSEHAVIGCMDQSLNMITLPPTLSLRCATIRCKYANMKASNTHRLYLCCRRCFVAAIDCINIFCSTNMPCTCMQMERCCHGEIVRGHDHHMLKKIPNQHRKPANNLC